MMRINSIKNITYSVTRLGDPRYNISKSSLLEGDVKDMSITGLDPNAIKVFIQELFVKKPEILPINLGR